MLIHLNDSRLRTHRILTAAGIPCTVVLDSAIAYVMERVDMVIVGTEAVVESGVSLPSIILTCSISFDSDFASGPCIIHWDLPNRSHCQSDAKTFLCLGRIL